MSPALLTVSGATLLATQAEVTTPVVADAALQFGYLGVMLWALGSGRLALARRLSTQKRQAVVLVASLTLVIWEAMLGGDVTVVGPLALSSFVGWSVAFHIGMHVRIAQRLAARAARR